MNFDSTLLFVGLFLLASTLAQVVILRAVRQHTERTASKYAAQMASDAASEAYRLADARASELRILYDLAETLNQTLPPERALDVGLEKVARQVGAVSGWLLTLTSDHKAELSTGFHLPANLELARASSRPWALCACLKEAVSGQLHAPRLFECERLARTPGVDQSQRHHLSIPVRAGGIPVGILNLVFSSAHQPDEAETRLLATLGDQFGGAIERARLFKDVHKLAVTDSLTGMYNRRHFSEIAEKELERARRHDYPISLAILDIDHFKHINDSLGHLAGDQVLIELARVCQSYIRRIDLMGRFGGEEILILMPETGLEQAQQVMERLRQEVEILEIDTMHGPARITISAGVACLRRVNTTDFHVFLDQADQALYRAKNSGRNQVRVI